MMIVALFSWWYGAGWARLTKRIGSSMRLMLETFSVSTLMRTLFDPFRQISAGQVRGPFNAQLRAFSDRLFSRMFGAFVRSFFISIGLVAALGAGVLGLVQLIIWPLLPLLPVIGVLLAVTGVTF